MTILPLNRLLFVISEQFLYARYDREKIINYRYEYLKAGRMSRAEKNVEFYQVYT